MVARRAEGRTLQEIGDEFGVTRERVRQILKRVGAPSAADVRRARAESTLAEDKRLAARIDRDVRTHPGSTWEEVALRLDIEPGLIRRLASDVARALVVGAKVPTPDLEAQRAGAVEALQAAATYEFPLTIRAYAELVRAGEIEGSSVPWLYRLFGNWTAACHAAGVECGRTRADYSSKWTDDDIVDFVANYLHSPGARGTFADYGRWQHSEEVDAPSTATLRVRFGSWTRLKLRALRPEVRMRQILEESS
jgi:Sigma-70, region 4